MPTDFLKTRHKKSRSHVLRLSYCCSFLHVEEDVVAFPNTVVKNCV